MEGKPMNQHDANRRHCNSLQAQGRQLEMRAWRVLEEVGMAELEGEPAAITAHVG